MLKQIVLLVSSSMKLSQVMLGNATVGIHLYAEVLYSHSISLKFLELSTKYVWFIFCLSFFIYFLQVAILIPYRDRAHHVPIVLRYLIPLLQKQLLSFAFFIINQVKQTIWDFWDSWWQQTCQVKSIVLGNVCMLRTT